MAQTINQPVNLSDAAFEQTILAEINEARRNPQTYVKYLEEYKKLMRDKIVIFPNGVRMQTFEGVKAVDEAIDFLKKSAPLEAFQTSEGLAKPAVLQLNDLIEDNMIGHRGKDGSDLQKRLARFGLIGNMYAESMVLYVESPRDIVMTMIIDDGIGSRGNRKNLFSDKFKHIGLAYGIDKKGVAVMVAVFADSFRPRNNNTAGLQSY